MKVFHAGITSAVYSSEAITQSFKDVFGDVCYFNWQENRFLYGVEGMRKELINKVIEYSPDFIFLHFNHTSEILTLEYYQALKKLSKVITYTEDVRKDISHFENISAVVDHMILTNIDDVETLASKGINNAFYLPVSYNHLWYKPQPKTDKYYGDIVFVGNNYVPTNMRDEFPNALQRQEMIAALKKEFGDKFQAYGLGQENAMLNPQQVVECYNNAKIAITHNNFTRKGYQSDRGLNAMGCGCLTMIQNSPEIFEHFSNVVQGETVWNYPIDLIEQIKRILISDYMEPFAEYQHSQVLYHHRWDTRAKSIRQLLLKNN